MLLLPFMVLYFLTTVHSQRTQIIQLPHLNLTEEIHQAGTLQLISLKSLFNSFELTTIQAFQLISATKSLTTNDNITQMFFLNNSQFTLNTNVTFDREQLILNNQCDQTKEGKCLIKLRIAAYDNKQSLVKILIQPIEINDINDNEPHFRQVSYEVNISENLVQSIPLESPIDADSPPNSIQACSVKEFTNLFNAYYNRFTSRLFLKVIRPLDREQVKSYALTLNCTDGMKFTNTQLFVNVLDANDNVPVFKQSSYNTSVQENFGHPSTANTSAYQNLIQVVAEDLDANLNGQLVYSLPVELNFDYGELFRIDSATGWIEVNRNELDYEKESSYVLKVKVNDLGSNPVPSYTDVNIRVVDLNDNSPKAHIAYDTNYLVREDKTNSTIWIDEELATGTVIGYLSVSDLDQASTNGHVLMASLKSVTFMGGDQGSVHGSDDMFRLIPIVQDYENLYYGLQVNARLDREQVGFFDLTFELHDSGVDQLWSELQLRIVLNDVNDNVPVADVARLDLSIRENRQDLKLARILVSDADEEQKIGFTIRDTLDGYLFEVDENGWFQVKSGIDREVKSQFEMTVRCMDVGGLFTDVHVKLQVIDDNDNLPVFMDQKVNFTLTENTPIDTIIGNLNVHDADQNPSTGFLIEPINFSTYFRVANLTGHLVVIKQIDTDTFNTSIINLTITAIDLDLSLPITSTNTRQVFHKISVSIQLIDLNDNPPVAIDLPQFTVYDDGDKFNKSELISFNSTDMDRDSQVEDNFRQTAQIAYVQRYTWQFVLEILKSQYANRTEIIQLVTGVINRQKELNVQPVLNVHLENVFQIKSKVSKAANLQSNLSLLQPKLLNWGVYNITIDLVDTSLAANESFTSSSNSSETDYFTTKVSTKLFVLDNQHHSNTTLFTELNNLLNAWFLSNFENFELNKYNNGDEMELLEQEYLKFYAAKAFEKANRLKEFFFSNSSLAIIGLVTFFSLIAILLIIVISYKHHKVGLVKNGGNKIGGQSDSSSSSISDSSVITTLPDVKKILGPIDLENEVDYFRRGSPSNSFFETSTARRNLSYPPPSLRSHKLNVADCVDKPVVENKNEGPVTSSVNSLEVKPSINKDSVDGDSFTIITSLTGATVPISDHTSILPTSLKPSTKHIPKLKPLSTFNPYSANTTSDLTVYSPPGNSKTGSNDLGYYGSSDNSENNSTKQVKLLQHQKYVYNSIMPGKTTGQATNSTSSFTSSVLSSPTSSSSSQSPVQRGPVITNLYPYSNQLSSYLVTEVNDNDSSRNSKQKDLNAYLERFEKIYNSDESNSTFVNNRSSGRYTKTGQRNDTYSYV